MAFTGREYNQPQHIPMCCPSLPIRLTPTIPAVPSITYRPYPQQNQQETHDSISLSFTVGGGCVSADGKGAGSVVVEGGVRRGRKLCYVIQLIYCPSLYDDQMSREQDKSKDLNGCSGGVTVSGGAKNGIWFDIRHGDQPGYRFFDKFKHPDYQLFSAFRLLHPLSPSGKLLAGKETKSTRRHRGNYRKYTVAEKEEAVKQILEGVDAKEISERYGIPRRNLLRWKKNGCERKEGGGRPTDAEMEMTLYVKIDQKILLTEKDIRVEAKRLSKLADFKASKGWYCKFSRRYNQWKRQQRDELIRQLGQDAKEVDQEVFLLPEASEGSDDDSDSFSNSTPSRKQSSPQP